MRDRDGRWSYVDLVRLYIIDIYNIYNCSVKTIYIIDYIIISFIINIVYIAVVGIL